MYLLDTNIILELLLDQEKGDGERSTGFSGSAPRRMSTWMRSKRLSP